MDLLDFTIYRHLSPGGVARFWAGRRVIDPWVTPRAIAERVGVSESGVRHRLRQLADRGFLRDQTVIPNPSLFGQAVFVADLRVRQSGEVDRVLRDLALVDGVVFTRDILDEDERKIQVHFLSQNEGEAARRATLIGRLSAAAAPVRARPYYIPTCDREPSSLDWKVLQCLRRDPSATLAGIRAATRISIKSAARSVHRLADAHACWWTHGPASEEFPLALVRVGLSSPAYHEAISEWIDATTPAWMPVAGDGWGVGPEVSGSVLTGLVPADVPTALERFLRHLADLEGVHEVGRTFALGSSVYPRWFDDHVAAKVAARR